MQGATAPSALPGIHPQDSRCSQPRNPLRGGGSGAAAGAGFGAVAGFGAGSKAVACLRQLSASSCHFCRSRFTSSSWSRKRGSPVAALRFPPCSPLQSRTLQNGALLRFASCPPVATARKPFQVLPHLGLAYPVRRSPWKAYRCRYACVACYGVCRSVWPLRKSKPWSWCKVDYCVSLQL